MEVPFINETDLPISSQLISFDLSIIGKCDIRSIGYILRCMPNLINFKFLHETRTIDLAFINHLIDGYTWQHIFEMHLPFLSKFDFHMLIVKSYPKLDLDKVINSFEYFVKKYPEWKMIIDRWESDAKEPGE
jgi:hypothetical protein